MKLGTLSQKVGLLAIVATASSISFLTSTPTQAQTAQSQTLLEQRGTLEPLQHEYSFSGKKGQAIVVSMNSDAFDPLLSLLDPSGREIATNDDYARTFNAAIVITLPKDGTYKILAQSVSGQGGDYAVTVKPATAYEQAYARGMDLYLEGKFSEALTAYTEAIRLQPEQPIAYLDRGDVYYAQGNMQALLSDYQRAADLYDKVGDHENAQAVRDQIQDLEEADEQSSLFSYPHFSSLMP
ncbi:tetratricopeptide repeat protein [Phormidium tenue FACHB-886]|nr:tetratricopeptide repeat protein [Phormidium tenue FACHB-886]